MPPTIVVREHVYPTLSTICDTAIRRNAEENEIDMKPVRVDRKMLASVHQPKYCGVVRDRATQYVKTPANARDNHDTWA